MENNLKKECKNKPKYDRNKEAMKYQIFMYHTLNGLKNVRPMANDSCWINHILLEKLRSRISQLT
jgi:hypothetical protein